VRSARSTTPTPLRCLPPVTCGRTGRSVGALISLPLVALLRYLRRMKTFVGHTWVLRLRVRLLLRTAAVTRFALNFQMRCSFVRLFRSRCSLFVAVRFASSFCVVDCAPRVRFAVSLVTCRQALRKALITSRGSGDTCSRYVLPRTVAVFATFLPLRCC